MTSSQWPSIVRSIMTEQGVSERGLAKQSGVHRKTLRNFLDKSTTALPFDQLERVLSALGYELEAIQTRIPLPKPQKAKPRKPQPCPIVHLP